MDQKKKILAIIPARGGSKRVPRKNIRLLCDHPLIAYTIQPALQTDVVDRVIVTTDDEEIAEVALKYGAEVPFRRPDFLAGDETLDQPVLCHALDWLKEHEDYIPDIVLHLRPTSPFNTPKIITDVIQRLIETGATRSCAMTECRGVDNPYWMYRLSDNGWAEPIFGREILRKYPRSQLLPSIYRLTSMAEAIKTEAVYDEHYKETEEIVVVVVPDEYALDIDTEFDFRLCELIKKQIDES